MNRLRGVLTTLLLSGFATLGGFLGVMSLLLMRISSSHESMLGAVLDGLGVVGVAAALSLIVPAGAALVLRPRHPMASSAVASMLGVGVFSVTASQATTDGYLLVLNLAALALLLCALPVPERRQEPSGRAPAFDR